MPRLANTFSAYSHMLMAREHNTHRPRDIGCGASFIYCLLGPSSHTHTLHTIHTIHTGPVRGLDIGCGANFIYCLLGAATNGWHMTGVDVTDVALNAAAANAAANPQLEALLEVRRSAAAAEGDGGGGEEREQAAADGGEADGGEAAAGGGEAAAGGGGGGKQGGKGGHTKNRRRDVGPILLASIGEGEAFHFCMCNPPFFSSIREANQNPRTACGGACCCDLPPCVLRQGWHLQCAARGGELAFVRRLTAQAFSQLAAEAFSDKQRRILHT